jgi:hypothetical protein
VVEVLPQSIRITMLCYSDKNSAKSIKILFAAFAEPFCGLCVKGI